MRRRDFVNSFKVFLFLLVVLCVFVLNQQNEVFVFKVQQPHGDCGLFGAFFDEAGFAVADELEVGTRCKSGQLGELSPSESGTALSFGVVVQDILAIILIFDYGFEHTPKIQRKNTKSNSL